MHLQTRILLKLLADDTTDSILDGLRSGPRTEAELVGLLSGAQKTANRRLNELREKELVDFELSPAKKGKRGARARLFRLSEPDLLRFCDDADAFALALAENRSRSLRSHLASRRQNRSPPSA